jgi:hypothetical protein
METMTLTKETEQIVVDVVDNYNIAVEPSEYQIIRIGFDSHKAAANFKHPNILATVKTVHEFKHDHPIRGKFWTAKAGVDHYIAVNKEFIEVVMEKGYSYVPAIINGVEVKFNVSGGTGSGGWTDDLRSNASISINHKLSDFKKLLELAEQIEFKVPKEEFDYDRWNELHYETDSKLKEKIYSLIEGGEKVMIILKGKYAIKEIHATGLKRKLKKPTGVKSGESYTLSATGAVQAIEGIFHGSKYQVKRNQIDWYQTSMENVAELKTLDKPQLP